MQADLNVGTAGHVDHGKTTLIYALTKKWTDEHSEELKRGITIKLGYANMVIRRCPKEKAPQMYTTEKKCLKHDTKTEEVRRISFIDVPGHETLMAIMMSGAALIDGVLFVIAANEKCPQPQTKEHLMALQIAGIKRIIIVQNKIDLVDEKRAKENYEEIKKFVKGTVAEKAPIIPISSQHGINIDYLLQEMVEYFMVPERDTESKPLMLIARSFDINKPGSDPRNITGAILGGVLKRGKLSVDDNISIFPGTKKDTWKPFQTKVKNINAGFGSIKSAVPGGNIGVETGMDPSLGKADSLSGSVVVSSGEEIPVWEELRLKINLLERVVGTEQELKNEPLKLGEPLMINAWTAKTVGNIKNVEKDEIVVTLKIPVSILKNENVAVSRMINQRWRLVGYGTII
jgi:translation initiation factor 2 subunit 3